jgi:hypothetical protein
LPPKFSLAGQAPAPPPLAMFLDDDKLFRTVTLNDSVHSTIDNDYQNHYHGGTLPFPNVR